MSNNWKNIWYSKYRPSKLDEMCLTESARTTIQKAVSEGIGHFLFSGPPGTGKTTMAKVLVTDILECDYIYINASDENGIDDIRGKVTNFIQTKSFDGSMKVVVLDEADGLSKDAQRCLRNVMEEYDKYARFILTANEKHKIIAAVQSRCERVDIRPTLKAVGARCMHILKTEGIKITSAQSGKLASLIKQNFPDVRKCINAIQQHCIDGELQIPDAKESNQLVERIWNGIVAKTSLKTRKYLIENEATFDADYDMLLKELLEHIYSADIDEAQKKQAIIQIANSLFESSQVIDKEINAFACILSLEDIIKQ
jgi:DNA polymerase III delta prime subunit